ncbi:carotenoid oxygenase family protein [Pseudomonas capeferrum]|uniref:carotenoid oxygenase family protein n=1 Tax=Pseudomonas capeferrum TaxID=1495066 RepID=UPI0015E2EF64|nr:carotenoid oxygenase family protein [Pseudomonas capeferrum]MBA1204826.1 carotenoid oxygenase family protein [Pseudomonas capeferrum]
MTQAFPNTMDYSGFNAPSRVECDIFDLVVEGQIPAEIEGTWFRCVPDPQYPPMLGEDTYLSGDGMVSAFRFENGHVDFKMRYIMTERLKAERKARRGLHGRYRNPYTDDPSVRGVVDRTVANTTPVWHAGKLLAMKEDGRPYQLDPYTLETLGSYDFNGALRSETMAAHTRLDPQTGELFFFGYEAGGLATRDVALCIVDRDGKLVSEQWFQTPYASFMHDFAVTREHIIFPVFPTIANKQRMEAGGPHWVFEQGEDAWVGIMPRYGKVSEMRWFKRSPACSSFHFMNAFSDGEQVHLDFGLSVCPPFPFIKKDSNIDLQPKDIRSHYVRWSFDLSQPGEHIEERVIGPAGDFPRVADKDFMVDYRIGYYQGFNPQNGPPLVSGPVGAGFNTVMRLDLDGGAIKSLALGPNTTVQEHVHIASRQSGHEGYLAFVVDLHDQNLSEVVLVEAEHLDRGPIARIKLPLRLRCQVHGNWVSSDALPLRD